MLELFLVWVGTKREVGRSEVEAWGLEGWLWPTLLT